MEDNSTQNQEIYVILNPHADKGKALSQQEKIEKCFATEGYRCVVRLTTTRGDAISLAYQAVAEGWRTIVAAGGDGTVNEVVDGMMRAQEELGIKEDHAPLLGIIPIGRGNDFAFTVGTRCDVCTACHAIVAGSRKSFDVGKVYGGNFPQGRYFVNGVGMGFEPLVNFAAMDFKHLSGMPSYLLAFIKTLIHYPKPYKVTMVTDHGTEHLSTQQISICNGRRMGSAFLMGPDAKIDDGQFDVVYAAVPIKGRELVPIGLKFFKGTQVKHPYFRVQHSQNVDLTCDGERMPIHADGEVISRACSHISVELEAGVLTMMV